MSRTPKSRTAVVLIAAVVVIAATGCSHVTNSTTKEREASFANYVNATIGDSLARDFLFGRVALLTTGGELSVTPSATEPGAFYWNASNQFRFASATPIDRRGYLLTAAHCVRNEPCYVMFAADGQPRLEQASIIWRGDTSSNEPDLALLWVPGGIGEVHRWSSDLDATDVMSVGPIYDRPDEVTVACFAGAIVRRSPSRGGDLQVTWLRHTAPVHRGDSGGPLLDTRGRLLAINVAVGVIHSFLRPFGMKYAFAIRPDMAWLSRLIEEHAMRTKDSEAELGVQTTPNDVQRS